MTLTTVIIFIFIYSLIYYFDCNPLKIKWWCCGYSNIYCMPSFYKRNSFALCIQLGYNYFVMFVLAFLGLPTNITHPDVVQYG